MPAAARVNDAVAAAEPHVDPRVDAAGAAEAGRPVVVGGRERADDADLAGPVGVCDHRTEPLTGAAAQDRRGHGTDVGERAQRREVAAGERRVVHEREQLRLHQEQVSDPLPFDRVEGRDGVVVVLQYDDPTAEQGLVDQDLGEVGELAVGQLPACGRGARHGDRGGVGGEVATAALGYAGRPAGGDDDGEIARPRTARQRLGRLRGGQRVQPECHARDRTDGGHPRGPPRREQIRRLREDHDDPRVELGDHPAPDVDVRRHGQVHGGRPDQVRGVADGQRVGTVRRQQRDEVAPAHAQPVEHAGVAVDRGEQLGSRGVDTVATQDRTVPEPAEGGDERGDVGVHCVLQTVGRWRSPTVTRRAPIPLQAR